MLSCWETRVPKRSGLCGTVGRTTTPVRHYGRRLLAITTKWRVVRAAPTAMWGSVPRHLAIRTLFLGVAIAPGASVPGFSCPPSQPNSPSGNPPPPTLGEGVSRAPIGSLVVLENLRGCATPRALVTSCLALCFPAPAVCLLVVALLQPLAYQCLYWVIGLGDACRLTRQAWKSGPSKAAFAMFQGRKVGYIYGDGLDMVKCHNEEI